MRPNLDPNNKESWRGLFDLLQPPQDYLLSACIGTTFGLKLDVLAAALLSMCGSEDSDNSATNVKRILAISRLVSKVRVLTHPGRISDSVFSEEKQLFDQLIIEVNPPANPLFHPKVWALQFKKDPHSKNKKDPEEKGRIIICSKNLSDSNAFEIAAVFEGEVSKVGKQGKGGKDSIFCKEVARALDKWMEPSLKEFSAPCKKLPAFLRRLSFKVPKYADDGLKFCWQGFDSPVLATCLPKRIKEVIVISPFISKEFIEMLQERLEPDGKIEVVSTPDALKAFDKETLEKMCKQKQGLVLYQIDELENKDEEKIEGLHAKILIVVEKSGKTMSFIGSANATNPGWGLESKSNVEAVVQISPGIEIREFRKNFIGKKKGLRPWILEFNCCDQQADSANEIDESEKKKSLEALDQVSRLGYVLKYDVKKKLLKIKLKSYKSANVIDLLKNFKFEVAPYAKRACKKKLGKSTDTLSFDGVSLNQLSKFIVLSADGEEKIVLGEFEDEAILENRNQEIRNSILKDADLSELIMAFSQGPAFVGDKNHNLNGGNSNGNRAKGKGYGIEDLIAEIARDPSRMKEANSVFLSKNKNDKEFEIFFKDMESALKQSGMGTC